MKKECNDCSKCPYFEQSYDYWGECDEWCAIHYDFIKKECYYPLIIRKILYRIWKIRESYYCWCATRADEKQAREEYEERIRLGMTEEEYLQWQYDEMERNSNS